MKVNFLSFWVSHLLFFVSEFVFNDFERKGDRRDAWICISGPDNRAEVTNAVLTLDVIERVQNDDAVSGEDSQDGRLERGSHLLLSFGVVVDGTLRPLTVNVFTVF